jgi:DNA replication protein DnaC
MFGPMTTVTGECERHGPWTKDVPDFIASHVRCQACCDEDRATAEAREADQRSEAAHKRRLASLANIGVMARHVGKTFDTFVVETKEQRAALEACRGIAEAVVARQRRIPSLILSGGPGTGKTHLTCAIIQHCYDAGREALKANVIQIIRDIKATWRKGAEQSEDQIIDWYASRDLLIVDEIGVQFGSDTERMYVFDIVNRRYEDCLPTVLITNLDINGLREEVGERVLDRLREDGGRLLTFTGKSWRAS